METVNNQTATTESKAVLDNHVVNEVFLVNRKAFAKALSVLKKGESPFNSNNTKMFITTIDSSVYLGYDARVDDNAGRAIALYKLGNTTQTINLELKASIFSIVASTLSKVKIEELIIEINEDYLKITDGGCFTQKVAVVDRYNLFADRITELAQANSIAKLTINKELAIELDDYNNYLDRDEARYFLQNVAVVKQGDSYDFVATNGHRLLLTNKKETEVDLQGDKAFIPLGFVTRIKDLVVAEGKASLQQYDDTCQSALLTTENFILLATNTMQKYPNYLKVIPSGFENIKLTARDIDSLIEFLKINAKEFTNYSKNYVKILIESNKLTLENYIDSELGSFLELNIEAKDSLEITFNGKSLVKCLQSFKDADGVVFSYKSPNHAVVLSTIKNKQVVAMPSRV